MISILPERDKEHVSKLYKSCGLNADETSFAIVAKSGDEILGFCLVSEGTSTFTLQCVEPRDDLSLADGIIRSAIHVGFENGKQIFHWDNEDDTCVFEKLKFIKDKDTMLLDSDKLFESCGGCQK